MPNEPAPVVGKHTVQAIALARRFQALTDEFSALLKAMRKAGIDFDDDSRQAFIRDLYEVRCPILDVVTACVLHEDVGPTPTEVTNAT